MYRRFLPFLLLIFFPIVSMAQTDYGELWNKVEKHEAQGLPKSALEVAENIFEQAETEGNSTQSIKALMFKSKYLLVFEEEAKLKIVRDFKSQIAKSKFPERNILESILANLYWQYFQENRWQFYRRTETAEKVDSVDFRTWDLKTLFREIQIHFEHSLENAVLAKQADLEQFEILLLEAENSKKYRPTLYDFLAHNALGFYKTKENRITDPAYKFEIDDPRYLGDIESFLSVEISSKDSISLQLRALRLYQDLIRFHLDDEEPYALTDVNIARLEYVGNNAVFENPGKVWIETLETERERIKNHEVSACYAFEIASAYSGLGNQYVPKKETEHRWKLKEALELCEKTIAKFPESRGAEKCRILKEEILSKHLYIKSESFLPTGKTSRLLIDYKNIDTLHFQVYKLNFDEVSAFKKTAEKTSFIKGLTPIQSWTETLPNEGDYQLHSTEVLFPKIENGHYLVFAKTAKENEGITAFETLQVTDFAWVEKNTEDKLVFQFIDRTNGKPLAGAKVQISYFLNRGDKEKFVKDFIADKQGNVALGSHRRRYYSLEIHVSHEGQKAYFENNYSLYNNSYYNYEEDEAEYRAFLFTDRSIYRPGQIVYFKGIALKRENGKSEVLAKHPMRVELYDVNDNLVKELKLTTNEFGSLQGEFILPSSGLNGQYEINFYSEEISDLDDYFYFSVEEYKRPTFEAEFQPVQKTFRINDSIAVTGEATAYTGSKITGGKVVYRVFRKTHFPYWRSSWWRPWPNTSPQEITHGETKTDENGEFEIVFKAIADKDISKENLPVFEYQITADITDINGETRSANTVVKVGYHALDAGVFVAPKLDKELKTHEITISTKNLNGEFVPAKGSVKIYKLKAPESVLRTRPWKTPDYQQLDIEEFKKLFPNEAYEDEANPETWGKGDLVFKKNFDTGKSKSLQLGKIKGWESGRYFIELETKDPFGQEVTATAKTFLFSPKDKRLPDQQLFSINADKQSYKPGETAKVVVGTAAENLFVTLLVEKDGKILETKILRLKNEKQSISIPIKEDDLGGFVVYYSFAFSNSFRSGNLKIDVPFPKKKLNIETLVFRDKFQPGKEETWSFKITGPEGEKASAELLAGMYDASLDHFKPHQWNFSPKWDRDYRSRSEINADYGFGLNRFQIDYPERRVQNYPLQFYDKLNWFGLNLGKSRNYYMEYLREKYKVSPSRVIAKINKGEAGGTVTGLVVDIENRMPLAGANIVVKGTTNGTQTDFDGKFSIENTQKGDVLNFTYVGYKHLEVAIGEYHHFEIGLGIGGAELQEVVVTAYDTTTTQAVTYITTERTENGYSTYRGNVYQKEKSPQANVNQVLSGRVGILTDSAKAEEFDKVPIRKNLRETAFFFPQLKTDENGEISFTFTSPEALTRWKLQLLAHTKTLENGIKTLEAVTQKELMVLPNMPRFLRMGDSVLVSAKIANLTENQLSGNAILQLYDAISEKEITENLMLGDNLKNFSVSAKGNAAVSWKMHIPENIQAVKYKVIAKSGNFSDGVQDVLPVLSNRMLVTESLPMWVRSNQTKTFVLEKLKNNTSTTLKNHKLTLEVTSNPAWYAIQALPYLMEYPYECSEQIFSRYYANALASHIVNSNPRVKAVFDQWKNTDALLSNLEKNQDLKALLLTETPWIRDAQSEAEQRKRIALLFDLNKMSRELESAKRKLQQNQYSSGAWPWFKEGRPNRFITQYIVVGFGHLRKLGVSVFDQKTGFMIEKSIQYLDVQFIEEYENITKYNDDTNLAENHLGHSQIHYLYMRSFFPEFDFDNLEKSEKIKNYYLGQIKKYWLGRSLYDKALMAMIMFRNGEEQTANAILKSLKETSMVSEEMGRYWKENQPGWFWHEAPIETQALMIEAFSEITNEKKTIDGLKIWLLKNKQTNRWGTTKSTTNAVYALLLNGNDWLSPTEMVEVEIGGKALSEQISEEEKYEAGTGYFKTSWNKNEIEPEMGKVQISKKGEGIAWGGLYWQYFEDLDKITWAKTPLQIKKKLFLKKNTDTGEKLMEIKEATKVNVGDLIRVRIELKVNRSMEFVHMKDMRASGLEPINVISQYKWQEGLGYYESTKDASTNFFFDLLPKGVYVFEYDLRANNSGDFSNGITTIQCMYAPEFTSHSEGIRLEIKP